MRVGIGITTRNRVDVLDLCLESFAINLPNCDFELWVMDDASDVPGRDNYIGMLSKYPFVKYHKSEQRQGIAKNKNLCLSKLKDCDHIFLFDDDCFPISPDWYEFFIREQDRTGIQHFLYQINVPWLGYAGENNGILHFHNSSGVFMYITKKVLEVVGGFDSRMGIYGYEHSQYTQRIAGAGLMNEYPAYCSPKGAENHIFSLDLDMNCGGKPPPHRPNYHQESYEFVSSLENERDRLNEYINHNAQFLNNRGFMEFE